MDWSRKSVYNQCNPDTYKKKRPYARKISITICHNLASNLNNSQNRKQCHYMVLLCSDIASCFGNYSGWKPDYGRSLYLSSEHRAVSSYRYRDCIGYKQIFCSSPLEENYKDFFYFDCFPLNRFYV